MSRLTHLWNNLRASFWFLPCLITALAVALAFMLIHLDDSALEQWMKRYPMLFGASAAGARAMLSTIAGSMISVVGIVFSMTLVALALASSQYSPRVLRTFMRSRVTQSAIGIFGGIFAYCLIVLRGVHGKDESLFVPVLAVSTAMLLAVVGVIALIFFIHHIALSIQASTILANIAEETMLAMRSMFPDADGPGQDEAGRADSDGQVELKAGQRWTTVAACETGYLQSIDYEALRQIACKRKLVLRVELAVGQFVLAGTPLFSLCGPTGQGLERALHSATIVSAYRTVEQDPAFGVRQLVDVALKALSPGVNDTTTAVMCIDYLCAVIGTMAGRRIPSPCRHDQDGLRMITRVPDFAGMLGDAFDQIRRNAGGNVTIIVRLIGAIGTLDGLVRDSGRRQDLLAQLDAIAELAGRTVKSPLDRELVSATLAPVRRSLALGIAARAPG